MPETIHFIYHSIFITAKRTRQKLLSGFFPLGGGVPPLSAKEKNLLFFTLIFR